MVFVCDISYMVCEKEDDQVKVFEEKMMAEQIKKEELKELYSARFGIVKGEGVEQSKRNSMWKILCRDFFQKYVDKNATIVDVAAGYCEFINHIEAKEKIAVDMNPDVKELASPDVRVIEANVFDMADYLKEQSIHIFFVSNFLEHLDSKESIIRLISLMKDMLAPGGKILILQPNIRLVKGAYWDFIDHKMAVTEKALMETAEMCGLKVEKCITRFLPYTTKSALPTADFLIKAYLRLMPFSGFVFGKQSFMVLSKP